MAAFVARQWYNQESAYKTLEEKKTLFLARKSFECEEEGHIESVTDHAQITSGSVRI